MIDLCEYCENRFTWDCEDESYPDIGGCFNFDLDMDTILDNNLRKKINKSVQFLLALYDANREEE